MSRAGDIADATNLPQTTVSRGILCDSKTTRGEQAPQLGKTTRFAVIPHCFASHNFNRQSSSYREYTSETETESPRGDSLVASLSVNAVL